VLPRKGETRRRTSHRRLASNNIRTLERLNAGHDLNVVVRVDTDLPPEGLRQAAEHAAHSGDLRSRHPAGLWPASPLTRHPPGTSSGCGTRATETARNPSLRQAPSIPQLPPSRPVAPFSPHLKCGFSVLFCRLYFAATSGVCLIRSGAPLVFKRNHTRKKIMKRDVDGGAQCTLNSSSTV
jgi:hypothetical protein